MRLGQLFGWMMAVCCAMPGAWAQGEAGPAAPPADAGGGANPNPVVIFTTSMGKIEVELNAAKAPITVANFLKYVDAKHYDGTIFHRVIPNFMVQGGGMDANMREKTTQAPIKNEAANGLKNERGTIAMARTNVVDSATAQFFINHKTNDFLNHKGQAQFGYAVFGKVLSGMDVVDRIAAVPTGTKGGHQDVPVQAVTIESVRRK